MVDPLFTVWIMGEAPPAEKRSSREMYFVAWREFPFSLAMPSPSAWQMRGADEWRILTDASCEQERVQSTERSGAGADPLFRLRPKQRRAFRRPRVAAADQQTVGFHDPVVFNRDEARRVPNRLECACAI